MLQTAELTERRVKFVQSLASVAVWKTDKTFRKRWNRNVAYCYECMSSELFVLRLKKVLISTVTFRLCDMFRHLTFIFHPLSLSSDNNSMIPEFSRTFISLKVQERPWRQSRSSGNHFLLRWFVHVKHIPFNFHKCLLMTWKQTILSWNVIASAELWTVKGIARLKNYSTTSGRGFVRERNWLQL